ncbi:hypothetical protein F5Y13DRAFT_191952 [Hypoxylon sp. FL1857]|nr:hypothetical protein F5Y13DRAFT_191952 [Hypoxylon sp. FL1857]
MAGDDSDPTIATILTITNPDRLGAVETEDRLRLNLAVYDAGIDYDKDYHYLIWRQVRILDSDARAKVQMGIIWIKRRTIVVYINHIRSLPRLYKMFVVDEDEFNPSISLEENLNAAKIILLVAYGLLANDLDFELFPSRFKSHEHLEALKLVNKWGGIEESTNEILGLLLSECITMAAGIGVPTTGPTDIQESS